MLKHHVLYLQRQELAVFLTFVEQFTRMHRVDVDFDYRPVKERYDGVAHGFHKPGEFVYIKLFYIRLASLQP